MLHPRNEGRSSLYPQLIQLTLSSFILCCTLKYVSGSWVNMTSSSDFQGKLEGRRKIKCPLPKHNVLTVIRQDKGRVRRQAGRVRRQVDMNKPGTPAIGYAVSVSSGNSSASNEMRVTIFDSVCMDCDSQGNCSQKVRFYPKMTSLFHENIK